MSYAAQQWGYRISLVYAAFNGDLTMASRVVLHSLMEFSMKFLSALLMGPARYLARPDGKPETPPSHIEVSGATH